MMIMLKIVLGYMVFFQIFLLGFFLIFQDKLGIKSYENTLVASYLFLFLFLFDIIFEYVKKSLHLSQTSHFFSSKFKQIFLFFKNHIHLFIHIIFLGLLWIQKSDISLVLSVLYLLYIGLWYQISYVLFFVIAGGVLASMPIILFYGSNEWIHIAKNTIALLGLTGGFFMILQNYLPEPKKNLNNFLQKEKIPLTQIFQDIREDFGIIFYDFLFVYFLFFTLSFHVEMFQKAVIDMFLFLALLYVYFKYLGNKLSFGIEKFKIFQKNNISYIIIFVSIFTIIFSEIFASHPQSLSDFGFFLSWVIFMGIFFSIFTDLPKLIKTILFQNIRIVLTILTGFIAWGTYVSIPFIGDFFAPKPLQIIDTGNDPIIQPTEIPTIFIPSEEQVPKIFSINDFRENLGVGDQKESVKTLQIFLNYYGYYNFEISGIYSNNTQMSMQRFLSEKCGWSRSNQGLLGPLGRECIANFLETQKKAP